MLSCVHVHEWGSEGHLASSLCEEKLEDKQIKNRKSQSLLSDSHPRVSETVTWQSAKLHADVISFSVSFFFFSLFCDSRSGKLVLTALETEDKETVYTAGEAPNGKVTRAPV